MTIPARSTDPATSHDAAVMLDRSLTERHMNVLSILRAMGDATDDSVADCAVYNHVVGRHEQARRILRTLREHGLVVPYTDHDTGQQATAINASGRRALLWRSAK